jgi:hypothetical protein
MTGCQRRSVSLSSSTLPLCHGRGSHRTLQENSVCSSRCRPPSAPHDFVTHQMTDHRETAHLCPRVFELSGFYTRQYGGSVWKSNVAPYGVSSTYEEHCGAEKQHKPRGGMVNVPRMFPCFSRVE